jgi:prepilin-type processing-associated H-X9-DG protein
VVVAIIGVLMAVLLPNLSPARAKARTTVCASNLRSLGLALTLYLDENDRQLPRYYVNVAAGSAPGGGAGRLWWFGFEPGGPGTGTNRSLEPALSPLAPYTANLHHALQCPEFPYADGAFFPKFAVRAAAYGYNLNLGPANPALSASANRYLTRPAGPTTGPAAIVAFADALHFDAPTTFNEAHYLQYVPGCVQPSGYAHFRHGVGGGKAQYVLLDGHVEAQGQVAGAPVFRVVGGAATGNLAAENGSSAIYGQ